MQVEQDQERITSEDAQALVRKLAAWAETLAPQEQHLLAGLLTRAFEAEGGDALMRASLSCRASTVSAHAGAPLNRANTGE